MEEITVGTGRRLREGRNTAVITIGPIGNDIERIIDDIEKEHSELKIAHYDLRFLKPLDDKLLEEASQYQHIITLEDGVRDGGMGSAILEWMDSHHHHPYITRLGMPSDQFVKHGTITQEREMAGYDNESIKKAILE